MAAVAGGIILLCCSSSSAAMLMMGGEEPPSTTGPSAPAPPPKPPVVVDVPHEFRTSSRSWGSDRGSRKSHNRGTLDSPQAWSAHVNNYGEWYQMDNGKIADIAGVAIKGRMDTDQWVKTFRVK